MKPRILDLFCGAGGAAMGYHRAGFEVIGVDINPQPNYPFSFIQADALAALREADWGGSSSALDAIHASPPCQAHTNMSNRWRGAGGRADEHLDLIPETRELILATGLPYVLENVPGASKSLINPVVLTGEMFELGVHRPRLFETNWPVVAPGRPPSSRTAVGVYGKAPDGRLLWRRKDGSELRAAASVEEAGRAMGVDWMGWRELAEAIPPAYTECLGVQLLAQIDGRSAAPDELEVSS